jgi:hypothetical protein
MPRLVSRVASTVPPPGRAGGTGGARARSGADSLPVVAARHDQGACAADNRASVEASIGPPLRNMHRVAARRGRPWADFRAARAEGSGLTYARGLEVPA